MNTLIAVIGGLAALSYFLFFIWMAIDAVRGRKFLWLLGILAVPIIGVVIYFFVEKEHDYMKISENRGTK